MKDGCCFTPEDWKVVSWLTKYNLPFTLHQGASPAFPEATDLGENTVQQSNDQLNKVPTRVRADSLVLLEGMC